MPVQVAVMGVAGAGKTTVARALADHLGVDFIDADDLHPSANIAKMAAGIPLDDSDREPWLALVGRAVAVRAQGAVLACSALKRRYRDALRADAPELFFVHLSPPPTVLQERLDARVDHFMPSSLLASQLAALEPLAAAESGITVTTTQPTDEIVAMIRERLPSSAG
jgi:carbohydrate kinase (thermoresistant glucokinase family)